MARDLMAWLWSHGKKANPFVGMWWSSATGQLLPAVCNRFRRCCCRVGRHLQGRKVQRTGRPVHLPAHCCGLVEYLGAMNCDAPKFLSDLGRRISLVSGDDRETTFLFQRISVLLFRFNSVLLHNSLFWVGRPPGALAFPFFHSFFNFFLPSFLRGLKYKTIITAI